MKQFLITLILSMILSGTMLSQGLTGGTSSVGHTVAPYLNGSGGGQHRWFITVGGSGAQTGHDANNCYPSIQSAIDDADAGDSIFVKAGTYSETLYNGNGGTAGSPIVICNWQQGVVRIQGADISANGSSALFQFWESYYIIQGLHFWWGGTSNNRSSDYVVALEGAHITMRYCTFTNSTIVDNSTMADVKAIWNGYNYKRGIVMAGDYTTLEYCNVRGFAENIAQAGSYPRYQTIKETWSHLATYNCIVVVSDIAGMYEMSHSLIMNNLLEYSAGEDGIQFQQNDESTEPDNYGGIIYNNVIRYCAENAIDLKGAAFVVIDKNIIYGCEGDDDGTGLWNWLCVGGPPCTYQWVLAASDQGSGAAVSGTSNKNMNTIMRRNIIYDNHLAISAEKNASIYNNTMLSNNHNWLGTEQSTVTNGVETWNGWYRAGNFTDRPSGGYELHKLFLNNLITNSAVDELVANLQESHVARLDYNDYYNHARTFVNKYRSGSTDYSPAGIAAWKSGIGGASDWADVIDKDAHSLGVAPLLTTVGEHPSGDHTAYNFMPTSGSPLVDAGVGELTTVTVGGIDLQTITVANSFPFSDGQETGLTGDQILIVTNSGNEFRYITAINYATETITLDRIVTVQAGNKVYYAAFSGTYPDIGAVEYTGGAAIPAVPTLSLPADAATDVASPVTMSWNAASGASWYHLEATENSWYTKKLDLDDIVTLSKEYSGFTAGATVQWRMHATNITGSSANSTERHFHVAAGAITYPVTLTLDWRKGTTFYTLTGNTNIVTSNLYQAPYTLVLYNPNNKLIAWGSTIHFPGRIDWPQAAVGDTSIYYFTRNGSTVNGYAMTAMAKDSVKIGLAASDEGTALEASEATAVYTFRMPFAMRLIAIRATVNTAPTNDVILVDIHETGTTVLGNKVMIDATEKTSTTATTAYAITDNTLADDAEITIFVDQVGSTIAGAGLKLWLIGVRL